MPRRAEPGVCVDLTVRAGRRRLLVWLGAVPAAAFGVPAWAAARVDSARLWPAHEYTRLILESPTPLAHELITLAHPDRIVVDLPGVAAPGDLARLPARLHASDPYVARIRFGHQSPETLRLVLDLKVAVNAQIFTLPPVAEYGYRLVVDLYPLNPVDPLMALLAAEEARRATTPEPAHPRAPHAARRAPKPRPITVAVDPGHGGEDPGAIGRRGTCEKDVVLAIGRRLAAIIESERNMRAYLTRDGDYYVPLVTRVEKARRVQADLFVSVHADAFRESTARGSSVFALSEHGATSAAAKWLAQRENAADLIGGVNLDGRDPVLARTLLDLSQTAQIADSLKVGQRVLDGLGEHNVLHKATVEQAGFAVLKAPDIPSILVETAFITNPSEELKLRSPRQQRRFAESIAEGIHGYFARNPPLARA